MTSSDMSISIYIYQNVENMFLLLVGMGVNYNMFCFDSPPSSQEVQNGPEEDMVVSDSDRESQPNSFLEVSTNNDFPQDLSMYEDESVTDRNRDRRVSSILKEVEVQLRLHPKVNISYIIFLIVL